MTFIRAEFIKTKSWLISHIPFKIVNEGPVEDTSDIKSVFNGTDDLFANTARLPHGERSEKACVHLIHVAFDHNMSPVIFIIGDACLADVNRQPQGTGGLNHSIESYQDPVIEQTLQSKVLHITSGMYWIVHICHNLFSSLRLQCPSQLYTTQRPCMRTEVG